MDFPRDQTYLNKFMFKGYIVHKLSKKMSERFEDKNTYSMKLLEDLENVNIECIQPRIISLRSSINMYNGLNDMGTHTKRDGWLLKETLNIIEILRRDIASISIGVINTMGKNKLLERGDYASKVMCCKIQGDFYRYLAELRVYNNEEYWVTKAFELYKLGNGLTDTNVKKTDLQYLRLVLSTTDFYLQYFDNPKIAYSYANCCLVRIYREIANMNGRLDNPEIVHMYVGLIENKMKECNYTWAQTNGLEHKGQQKAQETSVNDVKMVDINRHIHESDYGCTYSATEIHERVHNDRCTSKYSDIKTKQPGFRITFLRKMKSSLNA
ncbi:hypothetical protein AX774_g5049 [Zancudomyces culisetae]|uniref:14-3-3 domain-containing protein n=1 Tax=Zancudomyces culisetae TaxID=1213189 RepID=A0A1R1PKL3_ZANCU|nr:hypothetical protein AX774_g5049 [Zancudomyces culisetae]|eukprot:OMH81496.1 hypothetical protein AX774_g5049 [Zancudomyces culisetae]